VNPLIAQWIVDCLPFFFSKKIVVIYYYRILANFLKRVFISNPSSITFGVDLGFVEATALEAEPLLSLIGLDVLVAWLPKDSAKVE
jgi:hypothetical protein